MRDNGCRADVKDSTDISHPRAVHGYINDAFMSTWLVAIVSILELKALVAVTT